MDIVQAEKSNTIQSNKYSSVCTEREKDSDGNVETQSNSFCPIVESSSKNDESKRERD